MISLASKLDREVKDLYNFRVFANDGNVAVESETQVRITVTDANDNDPIFDQSEYSFTVEEEQPIGAFVGQVAASDRDSGANGRVVYSIVGTSDFSINSSSGLISTNQILDRGTMDDYVIVVKAKDMAPVAPRSTDVKVVIDVLDVNDDAPKFAKSSYSASIVENIAAQNFLTVYVRIF